MSNDLKAIAFWKPFTKKLKEHILVSTYVEKPPRRPLHHANNESDPLDLNTLFQTDDEDDEFHGFVIPNSDLDQLFADLSNSEEEFHGFINTPRSDLHSIFHDESTDSTFFGFKKNKTYLHTGNNQFN